MRFKIQLLQDGDDAVLPINYQYPLSAAIYKILAKGDTDYAKFLHESGYGKGFKLFTFSDLRLKFKRVGDRLHLIGPEVDFTVCFHLPEAAQNFVAGLFKSEQIVIADQKSKVSFGVHSILSQQNPLASQSEEAILKVAVRPISAIVAGTKNARGHYDYKLPDDAAFVPSLLYSWRNKIADTYPKSAPQDALLQIKPEYYKHPYRSRLVHIKDGRAQATKIKGSINYLLWLTAERRYIDLILNAGIGVQCSQGMGCLELVPAKP